VVIWFPREQVGVSRYIASTTIEQVSQLSVVGITLRRVVYHVPRVLVLKPGASESRIFLIDL
jgi:hypothetical protein